MKEVSVTAAPAQHAKLRVMLVAGARPNFMKVAPVLAALRSRGHQPILVHTGQHYDAAMSDTFFADLGLPAPDYSLRVGSDTHARQTARIMEAFEPVLIEARPDWLLVFGDVNSTVACALVGAKLRVELGCRIAHVEAGLRSDDWRMPEEVNRIVTDRICDVLFTPSRDADVRLAAEGVAPHRVVFVGNVMIDSLMSQLPAARRLEVPRRLGVEAGKYALVTLHRPSNVDQAETLGPILAGLQLVAARMPVVFPMHPRTRKAVATLGLEHLLDGLKTAEPLSYVEMIGLTEAAAVVLTDSGGVQEETTALHVPCVTIREQTERPVTVTEGSNQLCSWPPTATSLLADFERAVASAGTGRSGRSPEGWDGKAAERIADALASRRDS